MEHSEVTAIVDRYVETLREEFESELNQLRNELYDVRSELETEISNLREALDNQ
jgi:hypothetical protein